VPHFAANYLAVLPGHLAEKQAVVDTLLRDEPTKLESVTNLIRFLSPSTVDELVRCCLDKPPPGAEGLITEAAEFFPHVVRPYADRITDEYAQSSLWPGAPEEWVTEALDMWRETGDIAAIERLGLARTDFARAALLAHRSSFLPDDLELVDTFIENAGIFPESKDPSVYPSTLLGLISDREGSPHHIGAGFASPVPACPMCDEPAVRVLTLARDALPFPVAGVADPSFFWFPCDCDMMHYVYAQFTDDGVEGVMTEVVMPDDSLDWLPGELALDLMVHPNQYGPGIDAEPGLSHYHQVGGYPPWIQADRFPRCTVCGNGMRFLASIDSGITIFGDMSFEGILYGFWCEQCSVSVMHIQQGE